MSLSKEMEPVHVYLPLEVVEHIYSFASLSDKKTARLVSRGWNYAVETLVKFVVHVDQGNLDRVLACTPLTGRRFSVVFSYLPLYRMVKETHDVLGAWMQGCSEITLAPGPTTANWLVNRIHSGETKVLTFAYGSMERYHDFMPGVLAQLASRISITSGLTGICLEIDATESVKEVDAAILLVQQLRPWNLQELILRFRTEPRDQVAPHTVERLNQLLTTTIDNIREHSESIQRLVFGTVTESDWYDSAAKLVFTLIAESTPKLLHVQFESVGSNFTVSFTHFKKFFDVQGRSLRLRHIYRMSQPEGLVHLFSSRVPGVVYFQQLDNWGKCGLRVLRDNLLDLDKLTGRRN